MAIELKNKVKLTTIFVFIFLFGANSISFSQEQATTAQKLQEYIKYLASDELEGRYPGTSGIELAAKYIEAHFKKSGLTPLNGSSYRQEFSVTTGLKLGSANSVNFELIIPKPGVPRDMLKPQTKTWETGTDWKPMYFSENGAISGELVFAGYGVTAKEQGYDDYEGIDCKGKVVIVLTDSSERESQDKFLEDFYQLRYKATNARDHGAAAVIFVKKTSDSANTFYPLKYETMSKNTGIIVMQANRTSIARFFPKHLNLYPVEQELIKNHKPKSFLIPDVKVNITVELLRDDKTTCNIIGMVKGSDPTLSGQNIIIGAHYDHLGWGGSSSLYMGKAPMIHNGADDNASGTSAIMELAERISKNPLKRSVIFITFSGEEMGLLGSAHYVDNPLVPLEKTDFMLNLDMVGRLKNNSVSVFGLGTSPDMQQIIDSLGIIAQFDLVRAQGGFGPSDHASFYKKKMPVLMLITGVHEDYHRPSDDFDKINYEGEAKVIDFAELIARSIGNISDRLPYQEAHDVTENIADKPQKGGESAWFGIIPNFEDNPLGCKVSGASPGSPAQKAGLKENDIIKSFGDKPIKNLYDLTYALRDFKPGDKIKVVILRAPDYKTEETLDVTLARKR
ncbi:MAG: hypothetical protein QG635_87 [Bacteroidota bacterium]|nr:hypothetical protein [Bacteroidota bacterium]